MVYQKQARKIITFSKYWVRILTGFKKQSGRGPSSRQILASTSYRTWSLKPKGVVACNEKYLKGKNNIDESKTNFRYDTTVPKQTFDNPHCIFKIIYLIKYFVIFVM